jgi:predicted component of type VI protein secretion system
VRAARDAASLATALLDWRNQEFDAPDAVEEALAEIAAHHMALTEAVVNGARTLLDELSPEAIEKAAADAPSLGGVFGRHRALWERYRARYDELADNMRQRR